MKTYPGNVVLSDSAEFYMLAFSSKGEKKPFLSIVFFFIYMAGMLWNLTIIIVVYLDIHLHTPMYVFLCNLSLIDICSTTVSLPKLIDILLTGKNTILFEDCFIQMYFYTFFVITEFILLSFMAYDRYVAICSPLHYQIIINKEKCVLILSGTWISACVNSFFLTGFASSLDFCHTSNIFHFFCEIKAVVNIACADLSFTITFLVESFLFGLFPFAIILASYTKIISTIMHTKSIVSRKKAFSTCSSHLTVIIIFYVTVLCAYLKPPSRQSDELDQMFSVLYAAVTPMLNPLIYTLRNRTVKTALLKIIDREDK
ncbi:olfactory receptor-like protein OLF4 [Bombina bombina]|uniref:olfactory receptor-like protein OLF4 n=1 Tax=Bombina bombina TaxID=8345 RepID=UPI00235B13ED|nr:olfactory receptor-like protein OLF4 [Bombina bombina]